MDKELQEVENEIEATFEEQVVEEERQRLLDTFKEYNERDRVISFKELYNELKKTKQVLSVKTKIPQLDMLTDGFRAGDLIIMSGTTGMGKTSLLQTFVSNFDEYNPSLFFTYEVMPRNFLEKFGESMPAFAYIPHQHKDTKIVWLEQRILEGIAKYGVKIVMIDHLHYLLDMQTAMRANTSLLIGAIIRQLKEIAIKYEIIIFLVAHTKKVKFEEDEIPDLNSLRDSGMVAAEADYVLFIDRKKLEDKTGYSDKTTLFVAKNRWDGKTGLVKLVYAHNKFTERMDEQKAIAYEP